jgi:hypothetical protein
VSPRLAGIRCREHQPVWDALVDRWCMDEIDASKLLSDLSAPSGSAPRINAVGWVFLFLGTQAALAAAADDLDAIACRITVKTA